MRNPFRLIGNSLHAKYAKANYLFRGNTENEALYVGDSEICVEVKNEEIGNRLYSILNFLKEKEAKLEIGTVTASIDRISYTKKKCVTWFSIDTDDTRCMHLRFYDDTFWKVVTRVILLMHNYGYSLDTNLVDFDCDSLSEFLSYFKEVETDEITEVETDERVVSELLLRYVNYKLTDGEAIEETFERLSKMDSFPFVNSIEFNYTQEIIRMCYAFFKDNVLPDNLLEILAETRIPTRDFTADTMILLCDDIKTIPRKNIVESTKDYTIYKGNVLVFTNPVSSLKEAIYKSRANDIGEILHYRPRIIVKTLSGDTIGYQFCEREPIEYAEKSSLKFESQKSIITYLKAIYEFLCYHAGYISDTAGVRDNLSFTIEDDLLLSQKGNKFGKSSTFALYSVYELVLLAASMEKVKIQLADLFIKLFARYLKDQYGELQNTKAYYSVDEVKVLDPIVAREFVKSQIDGNAYKTKLFIYLIKYMKDGYESGDLFIDKSLCCSPEEIPMSFDFEVEQKFGKPLEKNRFFWLEDGRKVTAFERAHTTSLKKLYDERIAQIRERIKGLAECPYVHFVGASEILYSYDLNSDNKYKYIGHITEPIKGGRLVSSTIREYDNKELLKLVAVLFGYFKSFYLPYSVIYIDSDINVYIDILSDDFKLIPFNDKTTTYAKERLLEELSDITPTRRSVFPLLNLSNEEMLKLSNSMDSYCHQHRLWFCGKDGFCSECKKVKHFVEPDYQKSSEVVFEDEYATHYKLSGTDYFLKVYKDQYCKDSDIRANVESVVYNKKHYIFQNCFYPLKLAFLNGKEFLGYVYSPVVFADEFTGPTQDECIDFNSDGFPDERIRLKCLARLAEQVSALYETSKYYKFNPFTKVFYNPSKKGQVQIVNPELYFYYRSFEEQSDDWLRSYILGILENHPSVDLDSRLYMSVPRGIAKAIKYYCDDLSEQKCPIHNCYYPKMYSVCPKCIPPRRFADLPTRRIDKDALAKSAHQGGEAYIYPYSQEVLYKVFKPDKIDYTSKVAILAELIDNADTFERINRENHKFKFIYPQVLLTEGVDNRVCGYTMKNVRDAYSFGKLRKKDLVAQLGFARNDILQILITIGEGIKTLHERCGFYIGDLNGDNILFDKDKNVYFIDFDGMGCEKIKGRICTDGYIDPASKAAHVITEKDDWYSFAIHVFYYLTYTHPFGGVYKPDGKKSLNTVEKMEKGISLLGNHGIEVPVIAVDWSWMLPELKKTLLNIFEHGERTDITGLLKQQYRTMYLKEIEVSDGKTGKITTPRGKINAVTANTFNDYDSVLKLIDSHTALCLEGNSTYLILKMNNGVKSIDCHLIEDMNIVEVQPVCSNNALAIVTGKAIYIYDFASQGTVKVCDRYSTSCDYSIYDDTIYFISKDDKKCISLFRIDINDGRTNGTFEKEKVPTDDIPFKWFMCRKDKFIFIDRADSTDTVYCNSKKYCEIRHQESDSQYTIKYSNGYWLIVNTEGYGVVLCKDGTKIDVDISRYVEENNILNVCFVSGRIMIPQNDQITICNVVNKPETKIMRGDDFVTRSSLIGNVTKTGFDVVTGRTVYTVA